MLGAPSAATDPLDMAASPPLLAVLRRQAYPNPLPHRENRPIYMTALGIACSRDCVAQFLLLVKGCGLGTTRSRSSSDRPWGSPHGLAGCSCIRICVAVRDHHAGAEVWETLSVRFCVAVDDRYARTEAWWPLSVRICVALSNCHAEAEACGTRGKEAVSFSRAMQTKKGTPPRKGALGGGRKLSSRYSFTHAVWPAS